MSRKPKHTPQNDFGTDKDDYLVAPVGTLRPEDIPRRKPKHPRNHGRPWSEDDIQFLLAGDAQGMDAEDQANMLRTLKITKDEALRKYWRRSGSEIQMQTIDGHCIFYDAGCRVHAGRPKKCREWPLVKAIITDKINLETIRSSCPGMCSTVTYTEICQYIGRDAGQKDMPPVITTKGD